MRLRRLRTEYGDDPRQWAGSLHDVRRDMPRGARGEAAIRALDELRGRRPWWRRVLRTDLHATTDQEGSTDV